MNAYTNEMAWLDPMRLFCLLVSAMFGGGAGSSLGVVIGAVAGIPVILSGLGGAAIGLTACLTAAVRDLQKD